MTQSNYALVSLFEEKPVAKPVVLPQPVKDGDYFSILKLRYSLEPVEDWVQVKFIKIYRPPDHIPMIGASWVDPMTIDWIACQKINPNNGLIPIAWGFGPWIKTIDKKDEEAASFDLTNSLDDYEWVEKIVRKNRRGDV